MRSLVLALVIAFFGCPSRVAADDARPDFVLAAGTEGRLAATAAPTRRRPPCIEIASSTERFNKIWAEYVPEEQDEALARIDFESEVAVFLLLGPQKTGGGAVERIIE